MQINFNKNYKLGLRGVKTALAVFVCALISMTLFTHEDIFCSCIAAAMCMEQTYKKTIKSGISRFIGTLIGGLVGYIALKLSIFTPHPKIFQIFLLPICILVVVYMCNIINKKNSVSIGCVVIIVILSRFGPSVSHTLNFVFERVCDTILGIIVATVVNKIDFSKFRKKPGVENPN